VFNDNSCKILYILVWFLHLKVYFRSKAKHYLFIDFIATKFL